MFYLIKKWKIYDSCQTRITQDGYTTIEADFTDEELKKIENGYLYIDNNFIETEESIKKEKEYKISMIKKDISEAVIEYKCGKFKIRKKDFAPIIAQFMDIKENSIEPVSVLDMNYTPITFTYDDFITFKWLVTAKQQEILKNNS